MLLLLSKLLNPEETIVYIEKYDHEAGILLIDFFDSNQFGFFNTITGINYEWTSKPTMIEIRNYRLRRVREGSYYRISQDTWIKINTLGLLKIIDDSYLIGFKIELDNQIETLFMKKTKTFNQEDIFYSYMNQSSHETFPTQALSSCSKVKIIIKNVGQGSWNEILSNDKTEIVFDCGIIYTTKKAKVTALASSRDAAYQKDEPILLLSHWDVDHYHLLLGFADDTIRKFKTIICRGIIPNLTARKIMSRLSGLNINTQILLAPEAKDQKKKHGFLQDYQFVSDNSIILFNGSVTASRNQSGIGLLVRKQKASVVLPGDYHYKQVSEFMLPLVNYKQDHYLVIPHHGGKAGRFVYNIGKHPILKDAIASVGKNPYSHPIKSNMINLKSAGFKILRTDILKQDYEIKLY